MHMLCFCPFSSGYTFHEAHGVAPVKIEINYPDVVSILMPRDFNGSHGTHERFVLQVCRGTQECFQSIQEYHLILGLQAWARLNTLQSFTKTEFLIVFFYLKARSHGTALIRLHVNHIPNKVDFIMVKFFVITQCQFMLCLIHYSLQLLKLEDGMGFLIPASYIIMYC